jgi:ribosomal protein S18 acetylase RimI-like enzyme
LAEEHARHNAAINIQQRTELLLAGAEDLYVSPGRSVKRALAGPPALRQHAAMPSETIIRRVERSDLPALGKLGGALVRAHQEFDAHRFMPPPPDVEAGYAWFLGTQLDEPDAVIYVAERDGRVVGYVWGGLEPLSWKELREMAGFVHDVVVEESARGQGVGERLVEEAARWLEERGAPRVMLWTAEKNAPAQRLFARLGFRRTMIEMTRERRTGAGVP